MMRGNAILILLIYPLCLISQHISYHEFLYTSSSFNIVRWNISKDSLMTVPNYVEETTDKKGRVTQLRFLDHGHEIKSTLCYLATTVRYKYPNAHTIIALLFWGDARVDAGCDLPYRTIYTIDKDLFITKERSDYDINTVQLKMSAADAKKAIEGLRKEVEENSKERGTSIDCYSLSYSKYKRHYPVSKNHSFEGFEEWERNTAEYIDMVKCAVKK